MVKEVTLDLFYGVDRVTVTIGSPGPLARTVPCGPLLFYVYRVNARVFYRRVYPGRVHHGYTPAMQTPYM